MSSRRLAPMVTSVDIAREYQVRLDPDPDEGGFTVTVPALPGCITQGETIEDCLAHAQEAIALYLDNLDAKLRYARQAGCD